MDPEEQLRRTLALARSPRPSEATGQSVANRKRAQEVHDYILALQQSYGERPQNVLPPRQQAQRLVPIPAWDQEGRATFGSQVPEYVAANYAQRQARMSPQAPAGGRPLSAHRTSNQDIDSYLEATRQFRNIHGVR